MRKVEPVGISWEDVNLQVPIKGKVSPVKPLSIDLGRRRSDIRLGFVMGRCLAGHEAGSDGCEWGAQERDHHGHHGETTSAFVCRTRIPHGLVSLASLTTPVFSHQGPTGCGKTSLLNVLAGRVQYVSGTCTSLPR